MIKNIKEKIKEFNEIIKKYPCIKEFYIGRAKLYEENKQYEKALEDYQRVYINYFSYDIISICERNNLFKEAEKFYTKAINANKNIIKNYTRRAYFYMSIGKTKKALFDCENALKLSPNNENALILKEMLTEKLKFTKKN